QQRDRTGVADALGRQRDVHTLRPAHRCCCVRLSEPADRVAPRTRGVDHDARGDVEGTVCDRVVRMRTAYGARVEQESVHAYATRDDGARVVRGTGIEEGETSIVRGRIEICRAVAQARA